jgi:VWFA-related protein
MWLDGRLALIALAIFALAPSVLPDRLGAQSLARQDLPVFGTGVRVIAVPVFVTDKDGQAVPGLTSADFEIEDQGKSVPIVAFQAVDAAAPVLPAADAGPLVQAAAHRQFLLLFDLTFSTPVGIMKAREAAVDFVRTSLAPADLAAAATFGRSGVNLLVGFTSDRAQLMQAIHDLGLTETERERDPLRLAWDIGFDFRSAATSTEPRRMEEEIMDQLGLMGRANDNIYRQRVDGFLGSLERLGRMLDDVQGRKQVILMSGGFDSTVLMGEQGLEQQQSAQAITAGRLWEVQSDSYFGDAAARQRLGDLYDVFAASDTVLHTVDVSGLATDVSVDSPGSPRGGRGRETLAQFALNTGGHFIKDANDLTGGLEEVLDATRHYYILAFEPRDAGGKKDKLRKLKVKVPGRDVRVSHRAGYVLPDPEKAQDALTGQLQAAETIAKGLSGGPIGLRAVAVPYRDTKERTLLPVVLEIDGASLIRDEKAEQLTLEIFGYALDGSGRICDVLAVKPSFDLGQARETLRARGLQVLTTFAVPDGVADLRFLVREAGGGRAGSLRMETSVPSFEGEALALSPPLFMDDPRSRMVLPAASRGNPSLDIPFRLEDTAFTLDALPTLGRGGPREVCVMAWSGPHYETTSPYAVRAELVSADGTIPARLDGEPRIVADADGFQRFVVALEPGAAPPGRYTLRVSFRDDSTGVVTPTETGVAVE